MVPSFHCILEVLMATAIIDALDRIVRPLAKTSLHVWLVRTFVKQFV